MIKACGGNRGQIAPLTAVILAALVLLTAAVVVLAVGQKRAGVYYSDRIQAYYTAEDGVEEVLAGFAEDWVGTLAMLPAGPACKKLAGLSRPGELEVEGRRENLEGAVKVRLETKGRCRNAVRHVRFDALLYPPLDFGSGITAHEVMVEKDPEKGAAAGFTGSYVQKPAPVIEPDWFRRRADKLVDGDAVLDHGSLDGWYFVDGDLRVSGGRYEGRAIVFAAGRIDISGDYRPRGNACLVLVTPQDICLAPQCIAGVLAVAGGDLRLAEESYLRGGLITHRLCMGPRARVDPDEGLISRSPPVFTRAMKVDYWGELYHVIYGRQGG